ncbi:UNVERIFIED_CONTAM: hypothetical protein FKN15_051981 [Acipenser sinensis]
MINITCENTTRIHADGNPVVSTLMFIAGVLGNLVALGILGVHIKEYRTKSSVFCILVTGLAITDLLGTCFLSPVVFVSYARNASLLGLVGSRRLCDFFAFAMTFFGLASMLILFTMAVERCLAISHPYFYSKHIGKSFAKVLLPVIYMFCSVFCSLPFFAFGEHKQYCPGTWCFIEMESDRPTIVAFSLSYATLMAVLILVIIICNGSVIVSLCKMYRNQRTRRGSVTSSHRRRKTFFGQGEEEVDHLILLASMTTIFVICSLPLTRVLFPALLRFRGAQAVLSRDLVFYRDGIRQAGGCGFLLVLCDPHGGFDSGHNHLQRLGYRSAHRYHPCADSGGSKMNTRCPPKRVPSAARFFTLCRLTVQPPQSYSVGGQRSSGQLTGKPAGARPDYRGRWCTVSRGHPGRPSPPSPRTTLGQLSTTPWELPSTVGCGIAWTRTNNVQATERILHSSECFYWMRHSGAPPPSP